MDDRKINQRVDERANPYSSDWAGLRDAEKQGSEAPGSVILDESSGYGSTPQNDNKIQTGAYARGSSDVLREREDMGGFVKKLDPPVMHGGKPAKLGQLLTSRKLRKRSSLIAILLLLFGGGGFLTLLFSPSLAIVQMKEVFTKSLNDQLHAVDTRSAILIRSKLKSVTAGGCGVAVMPCKFKTISDKQVKKLEKSGLVKVERAEPSNALMQKLNRAQINTMRFYDDAGKEITSVTDPRDLSRLMMSDPDVRAAMIKGYNPLFATMYDKVAKLKLTLLKVTRNLKTTGKTDEERQKKLDAAVSGAEDSKAKTLVPTKDKDGNEIYQDKDGNTYSKEEYAAMQQQADRIANRSKAGGVKGVYQTAMQGAGTVAVGIGTADTACTVFNTFRYTSALAKTVKAAQSARFSQAIVLTPADAAKSGDLKEGEANFSGNNITATKVATPVLDESKLTDPANANNPATKPDPTAGMNAFDSPMYRAAAYGDVTNLSVQDSRFMLGGGPIAMVDATLASIARVVNLGDPDPKQVSEKCQYIQNPAVRFGALAVGIAAGVGSFGILTAVGIGASLAIQMALPYFEAQMADILAGNVFKGISGYDTGIAAGIGASVIFGSIAAGRGMKPVTGKKGIDYLNKNVNTYTAYVDTERYIARKDPLDITNQYSFLGTIASSLVPVVQRSKSSASMAMLNIASLIPTTFASMGASAKAASTGGFYQDEYFEKCNDQGYKALGIKAGEFCEVHYWMSDEQLAMDPVENAQWMVDNNEIEADSETGDPKDNDKDWNYAKYLQECPNRTMGYGENMEENEGDGSNCIDPAKEQVNAHYEVFTMDKSLQESMDDDLTPTTKPGTTGSPSNEKAPVSEDGWAFPTVKSDLVTKVFRDGDERNHLGVRIAGNTESETTGQPVFAAYDGRVVAAGPHPDYCNWIVITHDVDGKTISSVYGNLTHDGITVQRGDSVKAGDLIGRLGVETQNPKCVSMPYLYFELWQGSPLLDGFRVDPIPTIEAARKGVGTEAANV